MTSQPDTECVPGMTIDHTAFLVVAHLLDFPTKLLISSSYGHLIRIVIIAVISTLPYISSTRISTPRFTISTKMSTLKHTHTHTHTGAQKERNAGGGRVSADTAECTPQTQY